MPSLFIDSNDLLREENGNALRARAMGEGYLFFKGLLRPETVLALRADLLRVIGRYGWRQSGQDDHGDRIDVAALNTVPEDDLRTDIGVTHAAYDAVQKQESVHRLPHHPALIALYRLLFAREPLVHPRHIVRLPTPHRAMVPTPPHQDFPLIQGTANTWTCWIPVGDCPRSLGGLTVLRGSHRSGYLPIQPSLGAGLIASELCPHENDWVEGDFETGDILTFPSFTVHKALPSEFRDRIRLSLDVRYQPGDEAVEAKSLLPHCGLTWEQIYDGWEAEDLKYYWERQNTSLSPWNPALLQPSRRIC
ncbi:MAG: phytanoyl-CoA dioxygenase family protein [Armatimonadota bacterium]